MLLKDQKQGVCVCARVWVQVMETDTLNSIAVKFETTPTELARLNKKPLGATSTIFTGEVR